MNLSPKVSIIIRTNNEERWIGSCLKAVFDQDFTDFEVIIVDNESSDKTVEKANSFDVKITHIKDFLPGKALNQGINESRGKYLALLSGHCIPKNKKWLSNLIRNFKNQDIAGVYGRQEPMAQSSAYDKRDLLITFGLDKKVQTKDSFFHNANSIIRRDIWENVPFDEHATNIEDRIWASRILKEKYKIVYEPEASVYHFHGIHQDRDEERCFNVVRILEDLDLKGDKATLDANKLDITALIPIKGDLQYLNDTPLIKFTIQRATQSKYINRIIVLTDNKEIATFSKEMGAQAPFIREKEYSEEYVDLETVLNYSLNTLEDMGIIPDLIALLEGTFPFRPPKLIDNLIEQLLIQGLDTIIPGIPEFGSHWKRENGSLERVDEGDIPRVLKNPIYRGLRGLGCITYPQLLREKQIYGEKVGILELSDSRCGIEVRDDNGLEIASKLINDFWEIPIDSGKD